MIRPHSASARHVLCLHVEMLPSTYLTSTKPTPYDELDLDVTARKCVEYGTHALFADQASLCRRDKNVEGKVRKCLSYGL